MSLRPLETPAPADDFEGELEVSLLDNVFEPDLLAIDAGTRTKINLPNTGEFVHNLRIDGPDGEYFTEDDITSPDVLPGEDGSMVIEIEVAGTYEFQCDFHTETQSRLPDCALRRRPLSEAEFRRLLRVVLPAGLVAAFVAVGVAALLEKQPRHRALAQRFAGAHQRCDCRPVHRRSLARHLRGHSLR